MKLKNICKKIYLKLTTFLRNLFLKIKNKDFLSPDSIVNYMFSAESLPEPLPSENEIELVRSFQDNKDLSAKSPTAIKCGRPERTREQNCATTIHINWQ